MGNSKRSPDLRLPCNSTVQYADLVPRLKGWGAAYPSGSHPVITQSFKTVYKNVTKVPDYASGSSAFISPYARPAIGQPDCSPYFSGDPTFFECHTADNGHQYCGLPDPSADFSCPGGATIVSSGKYHNCYTASIESASCSNRKCFDVGFFGVAASKNIQGRFGYMHKDASVPDSFEYCCVCAPVGEITSPDTTYYTSISGEYSTTHTNTEYPVIDDGPSTCTDCDGNTIINHCYHLGTAVVTTRGESAAQDVSVDHYGNISINSCSSGSSGYTPPADEVAAASAFGNLSEANALYPTAGRKYLYDIYCNAYFSAITAFGDPQVITGAGDAWHLEWHVTQSCASGCPDSTVYHDQIIEQIDVSLSGGTLTILTRGPRPTWVDCPCVTDFICDEWITLSEIIYTLTDTSYDLSTVSTFWSTSYEEFQNSSDLSATLDNTYTSDDVHNELVALLGHWDMGKDYSVFRTDGDVTTYPYVTVDETGPVSPALGLGCGDYPTPLYTGYVKGAPMSASFEPYWDPEHENRYICIDDLDCIAKYTRDIGAYAGDVCHVVAATQATDRRISQNIPQGPFEGGGFFWSTPSSCAGSPIQGVAGGLFGVKYAEKLIPKRSYNYARPCGVDRLQISASTARCISSVVTHSLYLDSSSAAPTEMITGDKALVGGTGLVDGLWTIQRDGDYQITLLSLLASSSWFPTQPILDYGSGYIGKLKWQTMQPAICGRFDISGVVNKTPITCSIADPTFLINGDTVQILNASGSTFINGNWTISVIDNQTIVLSGSHSGSTEYTGNGQIRNLNSQDWKWDDDSPKNDWTYLSWTTNYRQYGEYQRLLFQAAFLSGSLQCDGITNCSSETPPAFIRQNQSECGMDINVTNVTCGTQCLPYKFCNPDIIYWSPNNENFNTSSSVNLGWFNAVIDDTYPTMESAVLVQYMNDPLYNGAPHCPCVETSSPSGSVFDCNNCSMEEDGGECLADQTEDIDLAIPCIKYFKHRDIFEARCTPPVGAPPLPSGSYLGCLSVADFSGSGCPQGNICNILMPDPNVFPLSFQPLILVFPAHLLYNALGGCVCSDGRFAADYRNIAINCIDE